MAKVFINESSLTAICNAIRAKTGDTDLLTVPNGMVNAINSIKTGGSGNVEDVDYLKQDMAALIEGYVNKLENEYVHTVPDSFFANYASLAKVDFVNCGFVGKSSFECCPCLREVNLPSLTTLSDKAFYRCPLTTVDFTSLQYIGEYGLYNCSLQTLTLPNIVTIGAHGLDMCGSLTKLDLGVNFQNWEDNTLDSCVNLDTLIIRSDEYPVHIPPFRSDTKIGGGTGYIYVPASLLQDYINNEEFKEVSLASRFRAIESYPEICDPTYTPPDEENPEVNVPDVDIPEDAVPVSLNVGQTYSKRLYDEFEDKNVTLNTVQVEVSDSTVVHARCEEDDSWEPFLYITGLKAGTSLVELPQIGYSYYVTVT